MATAAPMATLLGMLVDVARLHRPCYQRQGVGWRLASVGHQIDIASLTGNRVGDRPSAAKLVIDGRASRRNREACDVERLKAKLAELSALGFGASAYNERVGWRFTYWTIRADAQLRSVKPRYGRSASVDRNTGISDGAVHTEPSRRAKPVLKLGRPCAGGAGRRKYAARRACCHRLAEKVYRDVAHEGPERAVAMMRYRFCNMHPKVIIGRSVWARRARSGQRSRR